MTPFPRTAELSAITKTYDFVLWLLPHITKFPHEHRFTLGNRLEEGVLEILEKSRLQGKLQATADLLSH